MSLNIHKDDLLRQGSLIGEKIGFAKGRHEGLAEGINKGAYQKAIETAKKLIGFGLSIEDIARATGLSQEEVQNI